MQQRKEGEGMEYINLLSEIGKREIKHKAIQKELGISKAMLSRKLHGKNNFSLDEAFVIKERFFPDMSIETLFKR